MRPTVAPGRPGTAKQLLLAARSASATFKAMHMKLIFHDFDFRSDHELPAGHTVEIGRVIVRWAFIEHHVNTVVWNLAFSFHIQSGSLGILCIAEKPFEKRLKLISELANLRHIEFDESILNSIKGKGKTLAEERNLLAHGCWSKKRRHWYVKQTRGTWGENENGPSGPKGVVPEAERRTAAQIRKTVSELDELIEEVMAFKVSFRITPQLAAQRETRALVTRRDYNN
jgi:hypothetical protein